MWQWINAGSDVLVLEMYRGERRFLFLMFKNKNYSKKRAPNMSNNLKISPFSS